jgi:hypothetical protein
LILGFRRVLDIVFFLLGESPASVSQTPGIHPKERKLYSISNFKKIRAVGVDLFHTDGRTDGRTDGTEKEIDIL